MDEIIKNANLVDPNDEEEEYIRHIHDSQYEEMTVDEIKKSLLALGKKICLNWPQRCEGGYFFISPMINVFERIIE